MAMLARAFIVTLALQSISLEAGSPFGGLPVKPVHIVHAVNKAKDEVAKTTPDIVASSLKSTRAAVGELGGKAQQAHTELINGLPSTVQRAHEELHGVEQEQLIAAKGGIVGVQQAAQEAAVAVGTAVDQSRDVIAGVGVSAEDVTKSDVTAIGGHVAELAHTADKNDLAVQIRSAVPQMARTLNRTSLRMAGALAHTGSEAALLLNRTGHSLAGKIAGNQQNPLPFDLTPLTEVPASTWAASSLVLLLGAIGCMAYAGVCVKKKVTEARQPPVVLRETLMEEAGIAPMRAESHGPAFEPPQHVPLVG